MAPPTKIHLRDEDGNFQRPFIYKFDFKVNMDTLRREFVENTSERYPIRFSVESELHKIVGLIPVKWRLFGTAEDAPLLIVLCGEARNRIYRPFLHEDVGLAGGQIMLQAKALGLGTCWIGGLDRKAIAGILKVPDHLEIVGLLTVGFPAEDPPPPPRKSLAEIVHYDVYGNQADDGDAEPGRLPVGPLGLLLRRLRFKIRV